MSYTGYDNYFSDESPEEMNKKIKYYRRAVRNRHKNADLPSPDVVEGLVNYCIENEKFVEALEFSNLWIEYFPTSAEAWYKKGLAQLSLEMFENSLSSFEKAATLNPNDADLLILQAEAYDSLGELIFAEDKIREALEIDPDNEEGILLLGAITQKKGKHHKAIEIFESLINSEMYKKDALQEIAFCYSVMEDYPKAIEYYKLSIDEDPFDYHLWFNLGLFYYHNEQYNHSIDAFDMTLAIRENYFSAIYHKGCAYSELGKLAESIECFTTALEILPDNYEVMQNLAGAYADSENYIKAIELYSKIVLNRPYNYRAYFGRAICYDALEQFRKAIKDYDKALEFNKDVVEIWYAKGDAHFNLGQDFETVECYRMVIELDPFNFECMNDLGSLYISLDKYDYAEDILLECVSIAPNQADAFYNLGLLNALKGLEKAAAKYLSKAIQLDKSIEDKFYSKKSDFRNKDIDFEKVKTNLTKMINDPF